MKREKTSQWMSMWGLGAQRWGKPIFLHPLRCPFPWNQQPLVLYWTSLYWGAALLHSALP